MNPPAADRRREEATTASIGEGRPRQRFPHPKSHAELGIRSQVCVSGLRGCVLLSVARAPAAGERRSVSTSQLKDPLERTSVSRKVFEQGPRQAIVGHGAARSRVPPDGVPLADGTVVPATANAATCIPGDSPIGYRLPLDSQAWAEQRETIRYIHAPDQSRDLSGRWRSHTRRSCASSVRARCCASDIDLGASSQHAAAAKQSAASLTRTSMCAAGAETACSTCSCRRRANSSITWNCIAGGRGGCRASPAATPHHRGLRAPQAIRACSNFKVTPDPGVSSRSTCSHRPSVADAMVAGHRPFLYEAARECAPDHRKIHAGRPTHRNRRRQSCGVGRRERRTTRRFCGGRICCAACFPTGTTILRVVVPVFGPLHRSHVAGAAGRRSPQRFAVRTRSRLPAVSATRAKASRPRG